MASPRGKNKGVKKLKKLFGNKKGIQTILAALLMVVIVVVASVMVYAWSTGLLGSLLVTPQTGKEALNMDTYSFPSGGTQVTINIRNSGTASVTLQTYYVKDTNGNTWTNSPASWASVSISPNAVSVTTIDIVNNGATCSPSGCTFTTFVAGNSYTVTVITTRNNQFVFTVVR